MFYSKHRDEIIACLRSAYFMLTDKNLPVYELPAKLDVFRTRKTALKIPPDQFKSMKLRDFQELTAEEKAQIE